MATLISYSLARSVVSPQFICFGINFSVTWNNGSLIHFSKDKDPNQRQVYRTRKVLSLILIFFIELFFTSKTYCTKDEVFN